jgi:large subunit ribosomal protein L10
VATIDFARKKEIVEELSAVINGSIAAAVANYKGLTVADMEILRKAGRDQSVSVRVYRNTLIRRAIKDTDFACLDDSITGQVIVLFSEEEIGAPARVLRDFKKIKTELSVNALAIDGQLYTGDQLSQIASLPTRQEALSQLVSVMKAPITKMVRTTNEPVAKFVRVLSAVSESMKENS